MKRLSQVSIVLIGALVFSGSAYAYCASNSGSVNPNTYLHTAYSYTDVSYWGGSYGFTAERHDGDGFITYFQNIDGGGEHYFDNGTFSPWRRTSFYNWTTTNSAVIQQFNNNGPCY